MGTLKEDLTTVANAAFEIRCDSSAYDPRAREAAWQLWCLALEQLARHEPRLAAWDGDTAPIIRVSELTGDSAR